MFTCEKSGHVPKVFRELLNQDVHCIKFSELHPVCYYFENFSDT